MSHKAWPQSFLGAARGFIRETKKFKGTCWYCEKEGHKRQECHLRKTEEAQCWTCGEWGHLQKNCLQKMKLVGDEEQQAACPVRALRMTSFKQTATTGCQVYGRVDGVECTMIVLASCHAAPSGVMVAPTCPRPLSSPGVQPAAAVMGHGDATWRLWSGVQHLCNTLHPRPPAAVS